MLIFNANYRVWKDGAKQTVPAPVDPASPDAPWWYDRVASLAPRLAAAGYTHVLLPPATKTQSGCANNADGYGKFDDYDVGSKNQMFSIPTRFGTREQLQRCVAVCHANGLRVLGDVVLHQYDGGRGGVYRYAAAAGPEAGRFPKDPPCFVGPPPRVAIDPVWNLEGDFAFGDMVSVVHSQPADYMAQGLIDSCDWLVRAAGFDGLRVDDVKGSYAPFIHRLLTSKAMSNLWAFAEDFEGDPNQLEAWVSGPWSGMQGRCSAIDFTVHWHLQDVLDKGYPMQHLNGCGLSARDPTHAVTFVDSPDTDSSFGQQIQNSKLLAYAFIAAIEGVPQIYYRDWSDDPDCYGLGTQIDNLVWINRHLAGGSTVTRYLDDNCVVLNRVGYGAKPGLLMAINKDTWNSKTLTVATSFWPHTQLHDYTGRHHDIWTDANGWTTFTVPSNAFGGGQGYLCFGPLPQYVPAVSPHALTTVQEFEGADDLDIGPAVAGKTTEVTRIWVAVGTTVDLKLTHPEFAGAISPVATDPLGRVITSAVPSETLSFVATAEGWHELKIRGAVFYPLGTKIPFTLSAVYEAPAAAALA